MVAIIRVTISVEQLLSKELLNRYSVVAREAVSVFIDNNQLDAHYINICLGLPKKRQQLSMVQAL